MKIFKIVVAVTLLSGLVCLGYAYFVEPAELVTHSETIKIKNLDPAFNNLKIVAVSDIHGGSNGAGAEQIRRVVERVNEQNADVIVLLGDYVSQKFNNRRNLKMPMNEIADNLAGMRARFGVFAVLGNHDGEYSDETARGELERINYTVLENQLAVIEKDGHRLRIFGFPDHMKISNWNQFSDDAKKVLAESGTGGDVIALEHSPDVIPNITGDLSISPDLRLILCGHTHGGQIRLPIIGAPGVPSNYGQKYARGHLIDAGIDVFVTTGIGTSVLPLRFNVPPEIAVLTLESE